MSTTSTYLSIGFLLLFLLLLAWSIYVWLRRKTYTRERFAFTSFSGCLALTLCVISTISSGSTPWQQALSLYHYIKHGQTLQEPMEPMVAALLVVCIGAIYILSYLIFREWDGGVSRETYDAKRAGKDRDMIHEALAEIKRLTTRQPQFLPYKPIEAKPRLPDLGEPASLLPWKDLSRTLLTFNRDTLIFDEWRSEHEFWVAHHKDFGHDVALD